MKLEKNVLDYLDKSVNLVAMHESENFGQSTYCEFGDLKIESPIEQILYTALKTVARVNYIEVADPITIRGEHYLIGLDISPQYVLDNYRVDFKVSYYRLLNLSGSECRQQQKTVIVECDSQAFHERTETERRYEKKRDRHFAAKGYHVFHFTGKEILEDPYRVAAEVIGHVTSDRQEALYEAFHDLDVNL